MSSVSLTTRRWLIAAAAAVVVAVVVVIGVVQLSRAGTPSAASSAPSATTTPISHVVVIFDENVSYDHYFGTYPKAANTDGTTFTAASGTPDNDNLVSAKLLTGNPNQYQPVRLSPSQAATCDQNHGYTPEQKAVNGGAMDQFVQNTSVDTCTGLYGAPGLAMGYFDGNTVTGLWNYAQHFTMSDNSWDAGFGPSTPGALNLVSGQTHGFLEYDPQSGKQVATPGTYTLADPDAQGVGTVINDPDPAFDDCSDKNHTAKNTLAGAAQGSTNIGDLLNAQGVTWGWFQGGFRPTVPAANGSYAACGASHTNLAGASVVDYSPHHNPFAYYQSTANPHHLPPTSVDMIGKTDQANHQYDLSDFNDALAAGNTPAVSFLKAPEYEDGHAGYSDPIGEQHFLVDEINAIQKSPEWASTAVVIAYDDSDGWYDHVAPTITNSSQSAKNDTPLCAASTAPAAGGFLDRCGPSQRLPLLVISPYAKENAVSHELVTQASVLRFIEDNWNTGQIGGGSLDADATSLAKLFDFSAPDNRQVLLNEDGSVKSVTHGS